MPTIVKTPSGTWKALVRKTGFPTTIKTFRLKKDAEDWARRAEDEMVRGMFVRRAPAEKLTCAKAIERYLAEVSTTKRPGTQSREVKRVAPPIAFFGRYPTAGCHANRAAGPGSGPTPTTLKMGSALAWRQHRRPAALAS